MSILSQSTSFFSPYPSSIFVISSWLCTKAFKLLRACLGDSGKGTVERLQGRGSSLAVQWLGLGTFTAVASHTVRPKEKKKKVYKVKVITRKKILTKFGDAY